MLQSLVAMKVVHHSRRSDFCGSCCSEEPLFLHNVRLRGTYRRLCTPCVLKLHSGTFCPVCLHFFGDNPPLPHHRLMCVHCPSISHLSCVVASGKPPPSCYFCPICSNPNYFSFDHLGSSSCYKKFKSSELGASASSAEAPTLPRPPVNLDFAKQLMTAAQIALLSMNKAALIARVEAERRVKEATLARNRANQALEHFASLTAKREKETIKAKAKAKMASKTTAERQKIRSMIVDSLVAQKRIQNQIGSAALDSPSINISARVGKESNGLHRAKLPSRD